jgi:hypothetical protein
MTWLFGIALCITLIWLCLRDPMWRKAVLIFLWYGHRAKRHWPLRNNSLTMAVYYIAFWTTITLTYVLSFLLIYGHMPSYKVRRFATAGFYFAMFFIDLNTFPPQIAVTCHQYDFCPQRPQLRSRPAF